MCVKLIDDDDDDDDLIYIIILFFIFYCNMNVFLYVETFSFRFRVSSYSLFFCYVCV